MTDFNGHVRQNFRRDKRVRCDWCREWIEAGDLYRHFFQRYDGNSQQIRFHAECHEDGYEAMDWGLVDGEWQIGEMERGKPVCNDDPTEWLGLMPATDARLQKEPSNG